MGAFFPRGIGSWVDRPWWSEAQVRNLHEILDIVKRSYNVDENRVTLSGVSDGRTAASYTAMRDTTPSASFLPLNGSPMCDIELALDQCKRGAPIEILVSRNGESVRLSGVYNPTSSFGDTIALFPRRGPTGRVDVLKTGNGLRETRGVAEYTLLLSPESFDFTRPVTVTTNGKVAFEGRVSKSVATLLKWAAIGADRTMMSVRSCM